MNVINGFELFLYNEKYIDPIIPNNTTDIFSLGMTIWALFVGMYPSDYFQQNTCIEWFRTYLGEFPDNIANIRYYKHGRVYSIGNRRLENKTVFYDKIENPELIDLLKHMLDYNKDTRYTPADTLKHSFFKTIA